MPNNDLDRLRNEYTRRQNQVDQTQYSMFNKAHLFATQQRQRATINLLKDRHITTLSGKSVLEIGCGSGGVLLEYFNCGAELNRLIGIDLLHNRLAAGRTRLPSLGLVCANGQALPFSENSYDIVLQYTAFSSVLDSQIKADMAGEMLRVLKPDGLIIWYDFWLNPTNPQTQGICKEEIQQLFANCRYTFRQITLAPPLARHLVKISWILCLALEKLRLFNTNYLAIIEK
jgi:ubiquinone/menaquinone biosynthesis C-methylase UbiE